MNDLRTIGLPDRVPTGEAAFIGWTAASLPRSLHRTEGHGELVVVTGDDWAEAAATAIDAGAVGIIAHRPAPPDVCGSASEAALERIRASGVPVIPATTWAHNPAVAAARPHLSRLLGARASASTRIDAAPGSDLYRILLDQLALVRAAVGGIVALSMVRWDAHGYDLLGVVDDDTEVSMSAILSNALPGGATLRLLTRQDAVRLSLPTPDSARPGTVVLSNADGATLLPTEWETADRTALRLLHSLVNEGGTSDELDDLLTDIATVRHLRGA